MNFSLITLGELLSHKNEIVRRNALSILKQLQKRRDLEIARASLETRKPELVGHVGISYKCLYRHNPVSGYNESIDKDTGQFTGKSPY